MIYLVGEDIRLGGKTEVPCSNFGYAASVESKDLYLKG